jgi:hypothetical protein
MIADFADMLWFQKTIKDLIDRRTIMDINDPMTVGLMGVDEGWMLDKIFEWVGLRGHRYMRYNPSEKLEIIRIVEDSELSVRQTLKKLGIHRSTFYNWYRRYLEDGIECLGPKKPKARSFCNKIPVEVKELVVQ